MIKKILISLLISVFIIEIVLRVFFKVPDLNVYSYNISSEILLFKPNLEANISTRRTFKLHQKLEANHLPETIHVLTDQYGFRRSQLNKTNNAQYLVLGDSITLGWPVDFQQSAVAEAERQLKSPVASCGFMAMGPVQLFKLIDKGYCGIQNLKTVVIQITLHDSFKFPDTLFIDNFGDTYQSQLIYAINNPKKEIQFLPDLEQKAIIQKFNNHYFNIYLRMMDSMHLTRLLFFLKTGSRNQAFHRFEELAQTNVTENSRHEKTLAAIEAIASKFSQKPLVLINRTRNAMIRSVARPEVEQLLTELKKKNYLVVDMFEDEKLKALPHQYYYANDFHPNAEGHQLIGKKLAELLKKE